MHTDENRGKEAAKGGSLESELVPENEVIPFFRWSARVLGVIVACFTLSMVIGETFFGTGPPRASDILPVVVFGGYAIGMFLALKWERAGAMLGGVFAALLLLVFLWIARAKAGDPRQPLEFSVLLLVIFGGAFFGPIALYILCWWLEDRDRKRYRAGL